MAGAYYVGPGNRFWSILHESGLTPRRLAPGEFWLLPEWGIGLTDVCKTAHGMDREIAADAFDPARLRTVLDEVRPHAIAFNGKKAARVALRLRDIAPIDLGPTAHTFGAHELASETSTAFASTAPEATSPSRASPTASSSARETQTLPATAARPSGRASPPDPGAPRTPAAAASRVTMRTTMRHAQAQSRPAN
jgi:TDG/mug DNA glycosylase family protein